MKADLDFGLLADPEYVAARYEARQLIDAAAYGLGVAKLDAGPTGEMLDDAQRLSGSLREYTKACWPKLEPGRAFVPNWHLDAIAEHLEAVTAGQIRRLLINIPPRCMKSLSVSVLWMTWEWARLPSTQWLFLTYHADLCTRDSLRCRRLILDPWYQERWGHIYQLSNDQQTKVNFENNRRGIRLAKTMGGSRGMGGDRIVVDDPHNTEEAESEVQRTATLRDWNEEISTRHNDPETGATVVMMQRLHQQDLTGEIMDNAEPGVWEHLMLPMRFDPKRRCVTSLGFKDPRKDEGEPLWPKRFNPGSPEFREMEKKLGPYGVAGQWQQEPYARKGGQFERDWFQLLQDVPATWRMIWVRYWDQAGTQGGGKYTAGVLMGYCLQNGAIIVADVVRGQWGAGNRYRMIQDTAKMDALRFGTVPPGGTEPVPNKTAVLYRVEQEPGSGGKDSARQTMRVLRGYRAEAEPASGDKFIRADPYAGAAKNGDVHVLLRTWTETYLAELEVAGPGAAYLDQMDASSGAYNRLMELKDHRQPLGMQGINMAALEDPELVQDPGWLIE